MAAREQHDQGVADLAQLKLREREALYLHGLGYSYREIGALSWAGRVVGGEGRAFGADDMSSNGSLLRGG